MILMVNAKPNCFDAEPVRPGFLNVATQSSLVFIWMKIALKKLLGAWLKVTVSVPQPELWV
jgi:hypothetical protein